MSDNLINIIKNIHKHILYFKNKIQYDLLLHIGIVIFTAVASHNQHIMMKVNYQV